MNLRVAAILRNLVLPGFAGLLLSAISSYEVGLNTVRIMGPRLGPYFIAISQYYLESGLVGLAIASILFGLVATRYWKAWLAFTLLGLLARIVTGTVIFISGGANMWPILLAGERILAIASLGIYWIAGKAKTKVQLLYNGDPA